MSTQLTENIPAEGESATLFRGEQEGIPYALNGKGALAYEMDGWNNLLMKITLYSTREEVYELFEPLYARDPNKAFR